MGNEVEMHGEGYRQTEMKSESEMTDDDNSGENKCKCKYCEEGRQSEGGEFHLTEQENDDNVITLGERLHIAAKMVFLYPKLLSPSPHYPEWLNT